MHQIKGVLMPIGGNEDKGNQESEIHQLDFIHEGILAHVVNQAGGTNAKIIVVPTASAIPDEVSAGYQEAFKTLGCTNVHILDIRSKSDSEKKESIELAETADCFMFSGGDQSKISKFIGGTSIHKILNKRITTESKFVIAGTSAGAMMMAEEMIAGGSAEESFVKNAVLMNKGLGLIPDLIIDTHFIRRGRFGRLAEAVGKFPNLIGIGLGEDTGIIIKNGNDCTIIGSGMVIIMDGKKLTHNNIDLLDAGIPMTMSNLIVHALSNSDSFDIENRVVGVLPIEAPFI
ncbi:MAG: cyanophycinase [Psychromonas sp.]|jgi:cyanophycinase